MADPKTITIDSKTYALAVVSGTTSYQVQSGRDLRWERDFRTGSYGMGETVATTEKGDFFTDNMDTTKRGLRLSPTITVITGSPTAFDMASGPARPPFFFEEAVSTSVRYVYVILSQGVATVHTYKIDINNASGSGANSVTLSVSNNLGTQSAQSRPDRFEGKWYKGIAIAAGSNSTAALQQLTTVGTPSGSSSGDTWTSHDTAQNIDLLLRLDSQSGRAKLLRAAVVSSRAVLQTVEAGASGDGPLDEANWAPTAGWDVGDFGSSNFYAGGASHAGVHIIGKSDGAYSFDAAGNSYVVVPGPRAGGTALETGYGTFSFGNLTYYNDAATLWEIREVNRVRGIGPDSIESYTAAPNITTPIRLRHLEGCSYGHWRYFIYNDTVNDNNSYILAMEAKNHPVNVSGGSAMPVWHTIIKRTVNIRGIMVDSDRRLWWAEPDNDRVCYIQLAQDGSPDGSTRGNVSSTYEWYGPELDATHFGLDTPEITLQFRYLFVEVEGGTANCQWEAKYYLDGGTSNTFATSATTPVHPILAVAATNLKWVVGTTDTGRRLRLRLTATTNGSHSTSTDPKVIRLVCYARSPDTVTMLLEPATDTRNAFETAKILRKLKDQGPVTIREPNTNESHTGYIDEVNLRNLSDGRTVVQVVYRRYTTAA